MVDPQPESTFPDGTPALIYHPTTPAKAGKQNYRFPWVGGAVSPHVAGLHLAPGLGPPGGSQCVTTHLHHQPWAPSSAITL